MEIPEFNSDGDLPIGIYQATLNDTLNRFASGSPLRIMIGDRLRRIHEVASATGSLARFIIFGSFITNKREPNDVDIFMLMEDEFDGSDLNAEGELLFDHQCAQDHFGASVFWMCRKSALDGEQTTIEYWQAKRGAGRRGIIEIVEEQS